MAPFRHALFILLSCALYCASPVQPLSAVNIMSDTPIITVTSAYDFETTTNRLEASLSAKGLTLFAKVDHAGGAAKIGASIRPTMVFIFGNPKVGTPVIAADQRAGLDLPMRMVVYVGEDGETHITYRDPSVLTSDWSVGADLGALGMMTKGLAAIAADASGHDG